MSAALEIPRNENHPQTEEKQEEAIKEEILIRPEEYQKLNSFSDILIKLFYQLEKQTQDYVASAPNRNILSQRSMSVLKSKSFHEEKDKTKTLESFHELLNEQHDQIVALTNENHQLCLQFQRYQQEHQKEYLTFQETLQNDFSQRLDQAIQSLLPADSEFPAITLDTTAEELLRILTTRLQNLEIKINYQNNQFDLYKKKIENDKQVHETILKEYQNKFDVNENNFSSQSQWNHKTTDSIDILTEIMKKHQKEYKTFSSTQISNNNRRDELLYNLQNQMKKIEKHYRELQDSMNQKISEIHFLSPEMMMRSNPMLLSSNKGNEQLKNTVEDKLEKLNEDSHPSTSTKEEILPLTEHEPSLQHVASSSRPSSPHNDELSDDIEQNTSPELPNEGAPHDDLPVHEELHAPEAPHTSEEHPPSNTQKHSMTNQTKHKKNPKTKLKSSSKHHTSQGSHKAEELRLSSIKPSGHKDDHHDANHTSHPHELETEDSDLESRLIHTENELLKINNTMEMMLQGFRELGDRLAKSVHLSSISKAGPTVKHVAHTAEHKHAPHGKGQHHTEHTSTSHESKHADDAPHSLELKNLPALPPQSDHRKHGTHEESSTSLERPEPLHSSQNIEVEDQIFHVLDALVHIGNIGAEIMSESSPHHGSRTGTPGISSAPNSARSRMISGHHHGSSSIHHTQTADQNILMKAIEDMDLKQQEKQNQLEAKVKTLDDNYRQLKLQLVTIQDTTKGLKATINPSSNGSSTSAGVSSPALNKQTKKSYKTTSGKPEKDDSEVPDWHGPLEELKTKLSELKLLLDGVMAASVQATISHPHEKENPEKKSSPPSSTQQSVATQPVMYNDDDSVSHASIGELSLLTESMIDGHHQGNLHTTTTHQPVNSFKFESQRVVGTHHLPVSALVAEDGDMNDDLSDIHYDPSTPAPTNIIPMEQRIIKLEKILLENDFVSSKELPRLDSNQLHNSTDSQSTLHQLSHEIKRLKSVESENTQKISNIEHDVMNKLKYLTDSVNLMADEVSSTLPREEFHRIISSINRDLGGIKKTIVEKDWIQNKLQLKAEKSEVDRLIAGITAIIGDPFQTTVAAMHKCLVCDKPVSVANDGKPSSGYDKADDPHIPHSPIKRPGTVSGRFASSSTSSGIGSFPLSSNSTSQLHGDVSVPLPPVILPGGNPSDNKKALRNTQTQFTRRLRSAAGGGLGGSYQLDTR